MSNWDLMMPGMGLTAIGVAGVTISYAGVAHTFIDGMHALTGLTMFIGLIFLAAGILDGGVSTSNRAKATTLVVLGISLSFAVSALVFNSISSIPTFAGVMLIVAIPAIVLAYVSMKMPDYAKPIGIFSYLQQVLQLRPMLDLDCTAHHNTWFHHQRKWRRKKSLPQARQSHQYPY